MAFTLLTVIFEADEYTIDRTIFRKLDEVGYRYTITELYEIDIKDVIDRISSDQADDLGIHRCSECDAFVDDDSVYICDWCEDALCEDCYYICEGCGNVLCPAHAFTHDDDNNYCEACYDNLIIEEEIEEKKAANGGLVLRF